MPPMNRSFWEDTSPIWASSATKSATPTLRAGTSPSGRPSAPRALEKAAELCCKDTLQVARAFNQLRRHAGPIPTDSRVLTLRMTHLHSF